MNQLDVILAVMRFLVAEADQRDYSKELNDLLSAFPGLREEHAGKVSNAWDWMLGDNRMLLKVELSVSEQSTGNANTLFREKG